MREPAIRTVQHKEVVNSRMAMYPNAKSTMSEFHNPIVLVCRLNPISLVQSFKCDAFTVPIHYSI